MSPNLVLIPAELSKQWTPMELASAACVCTGYSWQPGIDVKEKKLEQWLNKQPDTLLFTPRILLLEVDLALQRVEKPNAERGQGRAKEWMNTKVVAFYITFGGLILTGALDSPLLLTTMLCILRIH